MNTPTATVTVTVLLYYSPSNLFVMMGIKFSGDPIHAECNKKDHELKAYATNILSPATRKR
jgi:hypothetical protein